MKDSIINSATKTFLEIPGEKLIDISINELGANVLVENSGIKRVYYVGKSYYDASNYYDIGVLNKAVAANWTEITTVNASNCSSFATSVYFNNAFIYGCSRLYPFRYNGICYENCSFKVFYDNGFERCIDKECNFSISIPLEYPRNWTVCIECENHYYDSEEKLICRQNCLPEQITYHTYNGEYFCTETEDEYMKYYEISDFVFNTSRYPLCYGATPFARRPERTCHSVRDCGELMVWNITKWTFSC